MPELSDQQADALLRDTNWGRWGADDQKGAVNLVTPEKTLAAVRSVRSGESISLSRVFPTTPGPGNPRPAQHYMLSEERPGFGYSGDYLGIAYHGYECTHVDALCHMWDDKGMWNGRDPRQEITPFGARFGDISQWSNGIVTRGVLLDVPAYRGVEFVEVGEPVLAEELELVAKAQGVTVQSGDALLVYSGREKWSATNGPLATAEHRPGLHVSCMSFIRQHDVAVLLADQMDETPNDSGIFLSVHGVIFAYGVALVDNALLQPLAEACASRGAWDFMLMMAPLPVVGGTGSPVNPIAVI
ncbi:MAG: hypothetical protein JWO10_1097 [Microbacteriaceae bacterium]|nr:hypothetical protein [Microbacteriaceae bacterium]